MIHCIYIEESQVVISKQNSISFNMYVVFVLASSVDPDEMAHDPCPELIYTLYH